MAPPNRRAILAVAVVIGAAPFILAAAPPPLPAPDAALVARAVAWLQALATAKGRFVQTDAKGAVSQGTLWLQRPGKARFEYDPPSGLVVASDGHEVSVVDRRLKTIQSYPLGLTPLALFLARDIRLDKGVVVTAVTRYPGAFAITAKDGRKKAEGQIVLSFSDAPLALTGWTITDAQGRAVRVRLVGLAPAPPREAKFFDLYDPRLRSGLGT
ncbi:MAG: outer-membrane lipoprotein carrier protein LolA [Caulobacteraceae bacterium]